MGPTYTHTGYIRGPPSMEFSARASGFMAAGIPPAGSSRDFRRNGRHDNISDNISADRESLYVPIYFLLPPLSISLFRFLCLCRPRSRRRLRRHSLLLVAGPTERRLTVLGRSGFGALTLSVRVGWGWNSESDWMCL